MNAWLKTTLDRRFQLMGVVLIVLLMLVAAKLLTSFSGFSTIPFSHVDYLVDHKGNLGLTDVRETPPSDWQRSKAKALSFGVSSAVHWFRFDIPADIDSNAPLLEVAYPMLDKVDLWVLNDSEMVKASRSGDLYPFAKREVPHQNFVFVLPPHKGDQQVYLRVMTEGVVKVPIVLWQPMQFFANASQHNWILGIFIGFLLAISGINLFFFFSTGSLTFLAYSCYVFSASMTVAVLNGIGYQHLWPDSPLLQSRAVTIFGSATLMFTVIFSYRLLDIAKVKPALYRSMRVLAGLLLLQFLVSLLVSGASMIVLLLMATCITGIAVMTVALYLSLQGNELARNYTLCWIVLLISALFISLDNLALISLPLPSNYLLMMGAGIEAVLLSLLFAFSYRKQQRGMLEAQQLALEQERRASQADKELLEVQRQSGEELEYKVQERTLELEITLRELSEANAELEKLNTLDSLTGVRNRRFFDKRLLAEARRSRREQTFLTVAMIDIDHFKQVNDAHGHLVGDECLRKVATLLNDSFKRPADHVCRYGGEEFAIIMANTELDGAKEVAERARHIIADTVLDTSAGDLSLTISIGLCSAVIAHQDQELAILRVADECLYAAKQAGRNKLNGRVLNADDMQQELLC